VATKTVSFGSVGPFSYDDASFNALSTDGQLIVSQAPTASDHVLRNGDMPSSFAGSFSNVTASRALNTTYSGNANKALLILATVRCAITLALGVATMQAKQDTSTPPTTIASGIVGIQAGLLNEDNSFQLMFAVPKGTNQKYRIDSVGTNGTVTLGNWFELQL